MANEFWQLSKDYRIDKGAILNPIAVMGHARKIFPYKSVLRPSSKTTRVYDVVEDINWEYAMRPEASDSKIGIYYEDIHTPVITMTIGYDYDDFENINTGLIPFDNQQKRVTKYFPKAEDVIALGGWTAALGKAVTSVSTTGTNSTVAGTELNLTSAATAYSTFQGIVGQFIDNFDEVGQAPFIGVMTPDCAKVAMGLQATSLTKETVWDELTRRLKAYHPGSNLMVSKYLGCTPAENAKKKSITAGTTNFALFLYDEEYYRVEHSILEPRTDGLSKLSGMKMMWVERFRPIYREKKAIVYSGTVGGV